MKPLIDGDILCYEVGFAAETGWRDEESLPPWWYVGEMLDARIRHICDRVEATEPPMIFLTGKTNFRNEIAKLRKYKDRAGNKPFHYLNIKEYLKAEYGAIIFEGLEADDLMAITQTKALEKGERTIICTRDKDLRQVPGWQFGWELANQPQYGPLFVEGIGQLEIERREYASGAVNLLKGTGTKFFYGQCLTGDSTDTIPGLPRFGPVKAFKLLDGCQTEGECYKAVLGAYKEFYGDDAEAHLSEQARLVWMVRGLKDGKPVMWGPPNVDIN